MLRLYLTFLGFCIQKEHTHKDFEQSLQIFLKKGLILDLNLMKKVLEHLTKNQKEEEYL